MKKRLFALFLCMLMCMTMLPFDTFAEEGGSGQPAADSFTVSFDYGMPDLLPEQQIVPAGGFATEPQAPTAQCRVFTGWYMDPECLFPFDFTTPVLGNMTVYAGWEEAHSWMEGVVTLNATCTDPGEMTVTCAVCGAVKTEAVPALGHEWGEAEITTPATCTEAGEKVTRCLRDGSHVGVEAIPALGHQWNEGEVTLAASCTEPGVKTFTCTVCGETRTEEIPAEGHVLVKVEGKNATCTEDGVKAHQECKVCGAVFFDSAAGTAFKAADAVIEATHILEHVDAVEGGLPEHWVCTECGRMFSDEFGNGEIKDESVKAAGEDDAPVTAQACTHPDMEHHAKVDATCKKAGNIEYWHCPDCGKFFSDEAATTEINQSDTVIPKLTHVFGPDYKCIYCKALLLDYLGNNYDEVINPSLSPKIAHYGCTYSIIYHVPYNKSSPPTVVLGDGTNQWIVPAKDPETGRTNYTMKASSDGNSTIITFSKAFIRSLTKNATYYVAIWNGTDYISNILPFKISSSPLTGDESNIGLWIAIGVVSAAALAGIAAYLIRSRKKSGSRGSHTSRGQSRRR